MIHPLDPDREGEEPPPAHEPLDQFDLLVTLFERTAEKHLGILLTTSDERKRFHEAVKQACKIEGLDFIFPEKPSPGISPMPPEAKMHTAAQIHEPGAVEKIFTSGEFWRSLENILKEQGISAQGTPTQKDTFRITTSTDTNGSGVRPIPDAPSGGNIAKKVA